MFYNDLEGIIKYKTDIYNLSITTDANGEYIFNEFLSIYGVYIAASNLYYTISQVSSAKVKITIYRLDNNTVYGNSTFNIFVFGYLIGAK